LNYGLVVAYLKAMNRGLDTADGNFPHVSVTAKKKKIPGCHVPEAIKRAQRVQMRGGLDMDAPANRPREP
jgi:hypothetical protein